MYLAISSAIGGLERVTGSFPRHTGPGDTVQLAVDGRNQPLERRFIATAPGHEQTRDVRRGRIGGRRRTAHFSGPGMSYRLSGFDGDTGV
jgi:hypothetical protein